MSPPDSPAGVHTDRGSGPCKRNALPSEARVGWKVPGSSIRTGVGPTLLGVSLLLLVVGVTSPGAAAQQTDTPAVDTVAVDTVAVDSMTTGPSASDRAAIDGAAGDGAAGGRSTEQVQDDVPFRPLAFRSMSLGRSLRDTLSARLPQTSVAAVLGTAPGSFLYDLGPEGWPHGVSWRGLAPQSVSLWHEGRSYDDLVSGRPRYDLLPLAQLEPIRAGVDVAGQPLGVYGDGQAFLGVEPITQIRFRRDSNGFQRVDILHGQKRQFDSFGQPGVLDLQFGFSGATASGEYAPGTEFDKYRGILGRVRYRRNGWAVGISNVSIRHRVAAHGGVEPAQNIFETVFIRPLVTTRNENAQRQTFRNDLTLSARGPLVPGLPPAQASITWTSDTFDFAPAYDTLSDTTFVVKANALQASLRQRLPLGPHRLTIDLRGRAQSRARGNTLSTGGRRFAVHASARDSLRIRGLGVVADAGIHATETQPFYPSAALRISTEVLGTGLFGEVRLAGQRLAWMETDGFEGFVTPLSDPPGPITLSVEAGFQRSVGPIDVRLRGYAHEMREAVDLYATTTVGGTAALTDTVEVLTPEVPFRQVGATLDLGWRTDARRGFYANVSGTAREFLNRTASTLHARVANTLPVLSARGHLGARFLLFQDLLFDVRVGGRGWTEMSSRLFHTPTGSLVVPPLTAPEPSLTARPFATPTIGPDGVLDVHVTVDLYGASLFFRYENALGGTQVRRGSFLVPTYPLPDQQFRFGVYWTIFD